MFLRVAIAFGVSLFSGIAAAGCVYSVLGLADAQAAFLAAFALSFLSVAFQAWVS